MYGIGNQQGDIEKKYKKVDAERKSRSIVFLIDAMNCGTAWAKRATVQKTEVYLKLLI